ncbi:hypothetical protein [Brevundimonas sp.]|jgi:hypothetical protein|uniref:hypothetical protein n=1 Tax=Brevundimonas sp. TaxID=1871086 RepID=UPI002E1658BB|nr:hypothetical protein [Brevundimonas sp.]
MPSYYANTNPQANGDHEVHTDSCRYLPSPQNRDPLGYHLTCQLAVAEARRRYRRADGCYWCCTACHKR